MSDIETTSEGVMAGWAPASRNGLHYRRQKMVSNEISRFGRWKYGVTTYRVLGARPNGHMVTRVQKILQNAASHHADAQEPETHVRCPDVLLPQRF